MKLLITWIQNLHIFSIHVMWQLENWSHSHLGLHGLTEYGTNCMCIAVIFLLYSLSVYTAVASVAILVHKYASHSYFSDCQKLCPTNHLAIKTCRRCWLPHHLIAYCVDTFKLLSTLRFSSANFTENVTSCILRTYILLKQLCCEVDSAACWICCVIVESCHSDKIPQ